VSAITDARARIFISNPITGFSGIIGAGAVEDRRHDHSGGSGSSDRFSSLISG